MSTTITTMKKVMNKFSRNAEIDEFLGKTLNDAGYGGVDITTSPVGTRITLYVQRPGLVIGRRGMGIRDLTEKLETKFSLPNPQISVVEEEVPELNPRIMCSRIAQTVVRGTAFRRAAIWAMNSMMNAGALGVEIVISGKLRSERAHFEKYVAGVVPKSGETADRVVRRATTDVLLKMGLYGVKVSIAIKNAVPPEVEVREEVPTAPATPTSTGTTESPAQQTPTGQVEEKAKVQKTGPMTETGQPGEEKPSQAATTSPKSPAPRSSRRSSTSKKERKKSDEES
ncbi:MAG TPA: 30S ribosomal protein S3 [Nitrososphaerales archaeon]|nr:30S ribosomal protein S3 [Nitrososphaerales archaeon]